ncbi:uncharacterized protein LOC143145935 [Ptiloglossa arizonensis]|uniref:uncharacterized protein LOC143145935 n=1 Tax=Ptiloglossa arizonensis TaxID=3350558 RepID=UPI003F9FAF56
MPILKNGKESQKATFVSFGLPTDPSFLSIFFHRRVSPSPLLSSFRFIVVKTKTRGVYVYTLRKKVPLETREKDDENERRTSGCERESGKARNRLESRCGEGQGEEEDGERYF